ncbi:MAG: BrnT family toxin [Sneathiella sp.]
MEDEIEFEWDEAKRDGNLAKHGVDFTKAGKFDFETSFTREDIRDAYGEQRYVSIGLIDGRPYVMVWCYRGSKVRVISLRKANKKERASYESEILR